MSVWTQTSEVETALLNTCARITIWLLQYTRICKAQIHSYIYNTPCRGNVWLFMSIWQGKVRGECIQKVLAKYVANSLVWRITHNINCQTFPHYMATTYVL